GVEVGRAGADGDGEELVAEDARRREEAAPHEKNEESDDRPLLSDGHAVSMQSCLSAEISAPGSLAVNTACPATKVSAPARQTRLMVSRLIPPSTSRRARDPAASRSARARRTLSTECSMK